ncbi:helix-turn-helix domain-containing protein [Mycolicibacterium bacteremicum]|nr:GAF domain-containing protein [Mycolicibacterium bacteremicum]MCV7433444.1 GAF domain-containing protein [Mycolicibacterium bacteremicum]
MTTSESGGAGGRPGAELSTWLGAMRELSAAATSAAGLAELLGQVATTARALLGFDFCGVLIPGPERTRLVVAGWSGLSEDYVQRVNGDRPIRLDGGAPSTRAFHSSRSVTIRDITADPEFTPWGGAAQEQGYRALISVPLIAGGRTLGTLNGYFMPVHTFTPFEIERMTLLANHAAIALTSADRLDQLRRLNTELREQRDALARSEEIHNSLLAVTLRSGGLAGVAAALSDLIGRPVLIEDPLHEILATAGELTLLPDSRQRVDRVPEQSGSSRPVRARDGEFFVSSPKLDGELVARIWFPDGTSEPDPMTVRAVEHASMVVSLELLRARTAAEVEQRLRGELLSEVLSEAAELPDAVLRRAQLLGHDLSQPHHVIVARINRLPGRSPKLLRERIFGRVTDLAADHRPRPLAASIRDDIVVLWPQGASPPGSDGQASAAATAAAVHAAIVGGVDGIEVTVAGVAPGRGTYAETFRSIKGALTIAVAADRCDGVVALEDLGVAGLLLQLDDPTLLSAFAARTLGPLRDYDRTHGTELVHTIRTYLACNQDRKRGAAVLHIHPNTLTQRLQRAETLCRVSLSDPAAVLQFATALTVDDVAAQL